MNRNRFCLNVFIVKWSMQIWDLGEEGYELKSPLQIVIEEHHDESFVARFPEIEAFGEGDTEAGAIAELKLAILDLYDELVAAPQESLGKLPQAWKRVLQQLIIRCHMP